MQELTAQEAKDSTPIWCPNNEFSRCERNRDGEFLSMEGLVADLLGAPRDVDARHRIRYEDLDVDPALMSQWDATEERTMRTAPHTMHRSSTWSRDPVEGVGWLYSMNLSYRTEEDTLRSTSKFFSAESRHPMWYEHLDFENRQLYIPLFDVYISAQDMQLLRMLLMGWDRQHMADRMFLSVYAIDKRLALFRKHTIGGKPFQQCMAEAGLASFILDCPDWFNSVGFHHMQAKHKRVIGPC